MALLRINLTLLFQHSYVVLMTELSRSACLSSYPLVFVFLLVFFLDKTRFLPLMFSFLISKRKKNSYMDTGITNRWQQPWNSDVPVSLRNSQIDIQIRQIKHSVKMPSEVADNYYK